MAARVRPRAAPGPLPGPGARVQRLPGEGALHGLRSRPRGGAPARPVAPLRSGALPPCDRADARCAGGSRAGGGARAQPCSDRGWRCSPACSRCRRSSGTCCCETCAPGPRASPSPRPPMACACEALDGRRAARGRGRAGRRAGTLAQRQILREYERAVVFRLGRLLPSRGPGPDPAHAVRGSHCPRRPADDHPHDPASGGDHARQRPGARGGRLLLPRNRPAPRDHRDRSVRSPRPLRSRRRPSLGARPRRARPPAGGARAPQRRPQAHHR